MDLFTKAIKENDLEIITRIQRLFTLHENRMKNIKNAKESLDSQLVRAQRSMDKIEDRDRYDQAKYKNFHVVLLE